MTKHRAAIGGAITGWVIAGVVAFAYGQTQNSADYPKALVLLTRETVLVQALFDPQAAAAGKDLILKQFGEVLKEEQLINLGALAQAKWYFANSYSTDESVKKGQWAEYLDIKLGAGRVPFAIIETSVQDHWEELSQTVFSPSYGQLDMDTASQSCLGEINDQLKKLSSLPSKPSEMPPPAPKPSLSN